MRIIIILLLIAFISKPAFSQKPSKKEMQQQMQQMMKKMNAQIADLEKQIAEAKKNKEDSETISQLESALKMMKKQAETMGGLNNNIENTSKEIFQQANEEAPLVPKKDVTRINALPKKTLTETELFLFIKNVHASVEKMIPAAEKIAALEIYNETKAKYKSAAITGNAASGCWMLGHWEKALFTMGKACMDDISDADNLNNYASFLISTGGEQAAIPILEYLDSKYPENSTIKNNLGQAWFGLGDLDKAKKNLDAATLIYPNHSMAASTLSNICQAEGDNAKAISFLKASLKESYDPEKEAALNKLGYKITYADMPPFNYPMKDDPFGLIPLFNSMPDKLQSSIEDKEPAYAIHRYVNGLDKFMGELVKEDMILAKDLNDRNVRLAADASYSRKFLDPYNCPGYLQARRSVLLLTVDRKLGSSPLITKLLLPFPKPFSGGEELPMAPEEILEDCEKTWVESVLEPINQLTHNLGKEMRGDKECAEIDAIMDAYLKKKSEIYSNGVFLIKQAFIQKSERLKAWILLNLYGTLDDPPGDDDDYTLKLVDNLKTTIGKQRYQNAVYGDIIGYLEKAREFYTTYQSSCLDKRTPDPPQGATNLSHFKVETLKCEYVKKVITPVRYEFVLQCNTITEKIDPKLEKRKPDIGKGSLHISNRVNQSPEPLQPPRGPYISLPFMDDQQNHYQQGPLTAEKKDPSQFSLEYDKWGNLVGFNFQLNEDGTALKDPDSIESSLDSRWSWNAIASSKKGFLNKLLIK
jgi:tetratricopeptide (TPR) repeat protein